ncbi:MAG: hypothetical protein ABSB80_00350 [Methanoregula sp.]|jgi:hypothetical protein|uniref:hypothetical protein n=1 Tax=Methanoregula sp. TaxID=2052170 RepID=UPI003D0F312C
MKKEAARILSGHILILLLLAATISSVHAARANDRMYVFNRQGDAGNISSSSVPQETPHYLYDPETGALTGYGTTPSPEEQKIIDQIRGPGYSPFPAPTPLAMDMSPEKPVYAYGDPVKVTITLSNNIADLFTFPGFPPAIEVSTRPDGWNKGIVRNLSHGEETRILKPHSTTGTILTWDQCNDYQVQVDPGVYYLTAQAKFIQNLTRDSTITFGPDPGFMNARSEVIIQYPQGALAGSLYPDTTVTDNEVTATLESLALDERGGFANLTVTAPAPRKGSDSPPGFSQVTTEYRVDDGTARDFRDTLSSWYGNGVNKVILHLAPVPCDAQKIQIAVTKFDPYRGHWNFTVDTSAIRTCAVDNETLFSREMMLDSSAAKKPAATRPSPLSLIFPIAALSLIGVISLMQKRWKR